MSEIVKILISESALVLLRGIASAPIPIPPRSPALVAAQLSLYRLEACRALIGTRAKVTVDVWRRGPVEAVLLGIERRFGQTMVAYKDAAGKLGYSYPALVRSPWPDPDWVSAVSLLGSRHPIAGLARVGLVAVDPVAKLAAITPNGLAALAYRDLPTDLRLVLDRVGGRSKRVAAIAAEAGLLAEEAEARLARLDEMGLVEQPNLGYWRAGPALELRCRRCLALPARPASSSCGPCGKVMQEEATGRRAEARKDGAPCLGCGQPKDGRKALFCASCQQRLESAERARRKAQTAGRRMRRLALRMLARQLRARRFSLARVASAMGINRKTAYKWTRVSS